MNKRKRTNDDIPNLFLKRTKKTLSYCLEYDFVYDFSLFSNDIVKSIFAYTSHSRLEITKMRAVCRLWRNLINQILYDLFFQITVTEELQNFFKVVLSACGFAEISLFISSKYIYVKRHDQQIASFHFENFDNRPCNEYVINYHTHFFNDPIEIGESLFFIKKKNYPYLSVRQISHSFIGGEGIFYLEKQCDGINLNQIRKSFYSFEIKLDVLVSYIKYDDISFMVILEKIAVETYSIVEGNAEHQTIFLLSFTGKKNIFGEQHTKFGFIWHAFENNGIMIEGNLPNKFKTISKEVIMKGKYFLFGLDDWFQFVSSNTKVYMSINSKFSFFLENFFDQHSSVIYFNKFH